MLEKWEVSGILIVIIVIVKLKLNLVFYKIGLILYIKVLVEVNICLFLDVKVVYFNNYFII